MKSSFTFSGLLLLAILFFSCSKSDLRGGGGGASGLPGGTGSGGTTTSNIDNTISSNFNGTAIAANTNIWFNAHFKLSGTINVPTVIHVYNMSISLPGQPDLVVPNAEITIDPSITASTYVYNSDGSLSVNIPLSNANQNIFFGGLIYPSTGLSGGLNPVDFTASFVANHPGVNLDWQWSAACFNTSMSYGALNMAIIDGPGVHAGAPLGYNGHAIGGARGGGAADLTGSWSGTGHVLNAF